ncbi:MAG: PqqD family protein [Clostridia bacterium]|nr:PqqD family protein [Clostridia bacterium]
MKLKKEFVTHETDGEQIMISAGGSFSGLVRSNQTAAFIVNMLKENTTEEEIVDAMAAKYDAPKDVIATDVGKVIEVLRGIGAIDE